MCQLIVCKKRIEILVTAVELNQEAKQDAKNQRKEILRFAHRNQSPRKKRRIGEQTNDTYSRFKNTISLSVPSEDRAVSMTVSLM